MPLLQGAVEEKSQESAQEVQETSAASVAKEAHCSLQHMTADQPVAESRPCKEADKCATEVGVQQHAAMGATTDGGQLSMPMHPAEPQASKKKMRSADDAAPVPSLDLVFFTQAGAMQLPSTAPVKAGPQSDQPAKGKQDDSVPAASIAADDPSRATCQEAQTTLEAAQGGERSLAIRHCTEYLCIGNR